MKAFPRFRICCVCSCWVNPNSQWIKFNRLNELPSLIERSSIKTGMRSQKNFPWLQSTARCRKKVVFPDLGLLPKTTSLPNKIASLRTAILPGIWVLVPSSDYSAARQLTCFNQTKRSKRKSRVLVPSKLLDVLGNWRNFAIATPNLTALNSKH